MLLGDEIEEILGFWGVTQENYLLAKSYLYGLRPNEVSCNCTDRKEFLNRLHRNFLSWMGVSYVSSRRNGG